MLRHCRILMIATMPESLFKTSGKGGTHTKVSVIILEKQPSLLPYDIFMAEAKRRGHDSRGNPTIRKNAAGQEELLDDIPTIAERYRSVVAGKSIPADHLGFLLSSDKIKNKILVPKYYNPEIDDDLRKLGETHQLVTVGELIERGVISIATGVEIGKMAYGTGKIPFIRTSDISNWEIKADFKHGVSNDIYEANKRFCDVKSGDIFMVRDGTYLIGTTAIVTQSDVPMLFQSHIFRIRVLLESELSPWLLLTCLNSLIVKRQIRAKQFTQDIIDTLGKRFFEIVLPFPKDAKVRKRIAQATKKIIEMRVELRNQATKMAQEFAGGGFAADEDLETL